MWAHTHTHTHNTHTHKTHTQHTPTTHTHTHTHNTSTHPHNTHTHTHLYFLNFVEKNNQGDLISKFRGEGLSFKAKLYGSVDVETARGKAI